MVQHWQLGLCSSCLVYRTTTPFLGPFLYRELDTRPRAPTLSRIRWQSRPAYI